ARLFPSNPTQDLRSVLAPTLTLLTIPDSHYCRRRLPIGIGRRESLLPNSNLCRGRAASVPRNPAPGLPWSDRMTAAFLRLPSSSTRITRFRFFSEYFLTACMPLRVTFVVTLRYQFIIIS